MRVVQFAIAWYVIGMAAILTRAYFFPDQLTIWDHLYFLWDKTKDSLLLGSILVLLPVKYRWILRPFFIYSLILVIWEVVIPFTKWDVNHPLMVIVVFSALLTGAIILFLTDLVKRQKQKDD